MFDCLSCTIALLISWVTTSGLQANITACSLVPGTFIFKQCKGHTALVLSVMKSADSIASRFQPMQSRVPAVNMTSARFYLPTTAATLPLFPYTPHFGASFVRPEMYSPPQREKDIRVLPAYMSYHSAFQGMPYHSTDEEKPTQSYIGLIGKAILSSPQQKLVLGDIYNYILTHYPYFRNKGPGWRNSIRHNLSLNDCFVKVGRSPNGKGHFWAINPVNYDDFSRGDYKRKRASRRNRESSAREGLCSKAQASQNGEQIKTSKDVNKCASSEAPCNTVSSPQGSEKRGFHIETLLCNKWEEVKTSEAHKTDVFTVSQGLLSATQKL